MMKILSDAELDQLWRKAFGEPLPILGAAEIVVAVLAQFEARAGKELTR